MPYNTPIPQQVVRATTEALSSQVGKQSMLVHDTTKNTLVVMDGVIAGGIPLAREDLKWFKVIEGPQPDDVSDIVADMPAGAAVYFTEEKN